MTKSSSIARPLGVGELLDQALLTFGKVLPQFIGVLLLIAVIQEVHAQMQGAPLPVLVLFWLLEYSLPFVAEILIVQMTVAARQGAPISLGRAIRALRLSQFCGLIVLYLWVLMLTTAGFLLLVVPGVIYSVARLLAGPIYLIEGCTMREALWRSKFLMTRGRWYAASSPMMRVSVVMFMVLVVVSSLAVGEQARDYFGWDAGVSGIGSLILGVAYSLFRGLLGSVGSVVYVTFYFDLRARYEGLDLLADLEELDLSRRQMSGATALGSPVGAV